MKKDKKQIRKELKSSKALKQCAIKFGLVGDMTRMKICWLLCHNPELSVSEIAELLDVSISAVSHSLKKLKNCDAVKSRREHKQVFYRLVDPELNQIIKQSLPNI